MIPKALVLRKPTQAEAQAHAVWSVRAGLNVAALQCRYSAWLRPVANYNDMLNNHLTELSDAQKVMQGHFRRLDGARGQTTFDQYNTRNYNSYSTLDAQYNFCDVAGRVGKDIRALPIGGLGPFAIGAMNDLRAALGRVVMAPALTVQMPPLPKPPLFVASPD